jgi:hypothetical protein
MKALARAAAAALLTLPAGLVAQGAVEGRLQRYTFDDPSATGIELLELRSVGMSARIPIGVRVTLDVATAWAEGVSESAAGTRTSISGFTDSQVVLGVGVAPGVTLSAIGVLPTGVSEQSLEESRVAGAIAADLLPFAITNWGSGGGGGGMVSLARPVGALGLGLSVSYLARRSFEPLEEATFAYRPGDVLSVVAAVDGNPTPATKAALRLAYHRYGDDQVEGANLFRSGDRVEATASLAFPLRRGSSGIVYGSFHHRGGGTFLNLDDLLADQDLVLLGGGVRVPVGGVVLQPDAQARLFRRSDGLGQGWDLGAGVGVEIPFGTAALVPVARVHLGNVEVREGVESAMTAFEVGLAARWGRGR